MKITDSNYNQLVAEAEAALAELVKSETAPAASAAPAPATGEPLAKSDEKKEEAKEAKADEKKDDDKCDYDDSDMEEMHKMYSGMGKAELGVHKSSLEKAWVAKCGDISMQKSEAAPAASLAKSEELVKAEEAVALAKAEVTALTDKLAAATKEVETAKAEVETLKKTSSELGEKLHEFLTKKGPQRKAVTSIEVVAKSEAEKIVPKELDVKSLTKSEITSRLNKKACDVSLSKADREAINKYCLVPGTPVDTVKHLLS